MKPIAIILICIATLYFPDALAQSASKIKILWINSFAPGVDDNEGIMTAKGDTYLYNRLGIICKNLVIKEFLKISCKKSSTDEMKQGLNSERSGALNSNQNYDYRIESSYTRATSTNTLSVYEVNCRLMNKGGTEIARVAGKVAFSITNNQEYLIPQTIRPVAYDLAQEIYKEIQSVPFENEKIFIYPQFDLKGGEDLDLYKSHMEHRIKMLEAEDPQIKILNQEDTKALIVEIKMYKLLSENNEPKGYMLYIKLKRPDGKLLFGGEAEVPKGTFKAVDLEIEKLVEAILLKNS